MKIKTEKLKELISKVSVGVGNNKLIPITELIGIDVNDDTIQLIATDINNYVYVSDKIATNEEFNISVQAERFVKLIGKLTSEYTELHVKDNNLIVKANGSYTIELPLDENGDLIKFPDPRNDIDVTIDNSVEVSVNTIKSIVKIAKSSLATTVDRPELTNYYVGDKVFATNGTIITEYRKELFDSPQLFSSKLMDIISTFTGENVAMKVEKDYILAICDNMSVYSKVSEDIDDYAIDKVTKFIGTEFDNSCKLNRANVINALDRISLFSSTYDNRAVRLSFTENALVISNMKSGSIEEVEYMEKKSNVDSFEVYINADMLMEQLKSYFGDTVTIEYGEDFAISLVSDTTTQIISLMSV